MTENPPLHNIGEMKVTEFQRAINVTSSTYGSFMKQNDPSEGMGSSVYDAVSVFFKTREL